jgi:glutathione S-transferase
MISESKLKLGYWCMRARGEPLRHLLEYLELPFEDRRYTGPE